MSYDVVLLHHSNDKPEVKKLATALLEEEGLRAWIDAWALVPGSNWQPAIARAIAACPTIAVCVGADGLGKVERHELQVALNEAFSKPDKRIIVVLLPDVEGEPALPAFAGLRTWVDFRDDYEEGLRCLVAGIRGQAPGPPEGGAAELAEREGGGRYHNKITDGQLATAPVKLMLINYAVARTWRFQVRSDTTVLEVLRRFNERIASEAWDDGSVPKPGFGYKVELFVDDRAAIPVDVLASIGEVIEGMKEPMLNVRWSVTIRGEDEGEGWV